MVSISSHAMLQLWRLSPAYPRSAVRSSVYSSGWYFYASLSATVGDLVLSGKLSREDLLEVGRELELLDRSFPRNGHSMMNEAMSSGFGFLKLNDSGGEADVLGEGAAWRFLPTHLLMGDAFESMLGFMKRCADADDKPWSEAERIGKGIQAEAEHLKNPISKIMIPGLTSSHRAGRERRAQLRLVRVAVHYRATGEVLDVDDPFGKKLFTSKAGDRLKVWSAGRDGVDGGGAGDWKPVAGKDIVLETDR